MAGRKKSVSVQEELLLCPSAKPGDWFPGIPVSAVAGIDEAGRGCLAGPVVAAAVILPEGAVIPGLADSKVLSPTRRDGLAAEIGAVALAWGLGVVWPPEIDRINILQATLKAMCHAASVLKVRPKGLLIDGNQTIPSRCSGSARRAGHRPRARNPLWTATRWSRSFRGVHHRQNIP